MMWRTCKKVSSTIGPSPCAINYLYDQKRTDKPTAEHLCDLFYGLHESQELHIHLINQALPQNSLLDTVLIFWMQQNQLYFIRMLGSDKSILRKLRSGKAFSHHQQFLDPNACTFWNQRKLQNIYSSLITCYGCFTTGCITYNNTNIPALKCEKWGQTTTKPWF